MSQTSGNELVCEISRTFFSTYKSSFDELFPPCCIELTPFLSQFEAFLLNAESLFCKKRKDAKKLFFALHISIFVKLLMK